MYQFVFFHISFCCEGFATNVAGEWTLACVGTEVNWKSLNKTLEALNKTVADDILKLILLFFKEIRLDISCE